MHNENLGFEVPFLPDAEYVRFLADNTSQLAAVYFSLQNPDLLDARVGVPPHPLSDIIHHLQRLPDTPKYALLNSRFQPPAHLLEPKQVDRDLFQLQVLVQAGCLDGIVFVDHYLLQALSKRDPKLCAQLEAVPGVNCMLDSLPRIYQHLERISQTAFKPPGKLILDRSLNRDLSRLREIHTECAQLWPDMRLGLLANEGCLPACPYKLTHDANISLGRFDPDQERTFDLNNTLGCARAFSHDPSLILRSPFIRPEDIDAYTPYVQTIKLGGRTRGGRIMRKVLCMYMQRSYPGNLLELMDTQEFLADKLYVANQALPPDFGSRTIDCGLRCYKCSYCASLASTHVQHLGIHIKPMWA